MKRTLPSHPINVVKLHTVSALVWLLKRAKMFLIVVALKEETPDGFLQVENSSPQIIEEKF